MIKPIEIILGILLPALVTTAILLFSWLPTGRRRTPPAWSGALAVGAGVLIGYFEFFGTVWNVKADSEAWIFWLIIAAVAAGTLDGVVKIPRVLWAIVPFLLAAGTTHLLINYHAHTAPAFKCLPWALGAVVALSWWGLDYAGNKRPGAWAAFLVFLVMPAAAIVVADEWIDGGKFGGTLAAVAGAVMFATLIFPQAPVSRGLSLTLLLCLFGLLIYNFLINQIHLNDMPSEHVRSLFLLLATPGLIAIAEIPPLRRTGWWGRGIIKLALVLSVLAYVTIPAIQSLHKTMQEDAGQTEE